MIFDMHPWLVREATELSGHHKLWTEGIIRGRQTVTTRAPGLAIIAVILIFIHEALLRRNHWPFISLAFPDIPFHFCVEHNASRIQLWKDFYTTS